MLIKHKKLDRFFFRFVTIHAFDGQTNTFLTTRLPCIQCSTVIIIILILILSVLLL